MRRIITLTLAAALVVVMLATGPLPANAQLLDPGPVGWRELPSFGWAYCDNFYDSDHVYWCWHESYGGHWFKVSPTI
jgi:hypothetical protein